MAWHTDPVPLSPSSHFEYVYRPYRDTAWAFIYAAAWVISVLGGVYAWMYRQPAFFTYDEQTFTDPKYCPYSSNGRSLLMSLEVEEPQFDEVDFAKHASTWTLLSCFLSLLVGVGFLLAFKHHSHTMTKATIYSQIAAPLCLGIALLFNGIIGPSVFMFGMAALSALLFYLWRREISLASRLLTVSAHGLAANPHLITTTLLLNIGALACLIPLVIFGVLALSNGQLIPNPARGGKGECIDAATGQKTLCCIWQTDKWVGVYGAFVITTALWTMFVMNQIRVFVTSGTIGQWYFAPASIDSNGVHQQQQSTRGNTVRSLMHAVTSSFGTVCFGGLVLTIAEMVRSASDRASRDGNNNIFSIIFYFIAQCFAGIVSYLTKFATVMAAITGEGLIAAGRNVTDLLVRNLLDAFASTVWFTPMVIKLAAMTLSVTWGTLAGLGYYTLKPSAGEMYHSSNAIGVGMVSGIAALFVLSFLGGCLLSVLDATFVCWAIDKDSQTVSHPEVFAVFETVPLKGGAVVEQPDGELRYGHEYGPV
jgi:hypothetical protein